MTTHRQLYVSPRAREVKGEIVAVPGAWVIREVTTSTDHPPAWIELSSGSPSLVTLIPDALSLFEQANDTAGLTITSRPVGPDVGAALPATPAGLDVVAAGSMISLCLPIGGDYSDVWLWAYRYRDRFDVDDKSTRFRRPALRWAIAGIFNERRGITSDTIDPHSQVLRRINTLQAQIELWIRPTWSAAEIFPAAFPPREDLRRPPLRMSEGAKRELEAIAEGKERERRASRARAVAAETKAGNAQWAKERAEAQKRTEAKAAHEREVMRRVRAEMDS